MDVESEHEWDDFPDPEAKKSVKRSRQSKQTTSRKRQKGKQPRKRTDSDDDDLDDDSDSDSDESDVSVDIHPVRRAARTENTANKSAAGRPLRSTVKNTTKYVDSDTEEETENSDGALVQNDGDPPSTIPGTASLIIKLTVPNIVRYRETIKPFEAQGRQTRSGLRQAINTPSSRVGSRIGSRAGSRAASRAPSANPSLTGHRRSSRLNRNSAEPAIQLTDSGHHAVYAEYPVPSSGPTRTEGKGMKKPAIPAIIEEESEEMTPIEQTAQVPDEILPQAPQPPGDENQVLADISVKTVHVDATNTIESQLIPAQTQRTDLYSSQAIDPADDELQVITTKTNVKPVQTTVSTRRSSSASQDVDRMNRKRKLASIAEAKRPPKKPRRDYYYQQLDGSDFDPDQNPASPADDEDEDMSAADEVSDSSQNVRSLRSNDPEAITRKNHGTKSRNTRARELVDDVDESGRERRGSGNGIRSSELSWLEDQAESARSRLVPDPKKPGKMIRIPGIPQEPEPAGTRGLRKIQRTNYTLPPIELDGDRGARAAPAPLRTWRAKPGVHIGYAPVNATQEQLAAHRAANPEDSSNDDEPPVAGQAAAHTAAVPTTGGSKPGPNPATMAVKSEAIDPTQTFDKVGGLKPILEQLREMINIPFMYGKELAEGQLPMPAQGILFHGPPGTGKTLAVRALAATLKKEGHDVTLYIKKGSDLMSKYVGEAERNVKNLFEDAENNGPSIIFFDEFDGIAPVRGGAGGDSHHYNSIVATLLASMDGMLGRGRVTVIGATNRPDNIDPAFRRPGRFDKEFYFPLPNQADRESILNIYAGDHPLPGQLKQTIAEMTKGYSGADLKAVCAQAQMNAVKRTFPQIFLTDKRLKIDPSKIKVGMRDYTVALESIVPTTIRSGTSAYKPLSDEVRPLLSKPLEALSSLVRKILPLRKRSTALEEAMFEPYADADGGAAREALQMEFDARRIYRPRCLITGLSGMGQPMLASALLFQLEGVYVQAFDLATLHQDSGKPLAAIISSHFAEVKRHSPSVIFIREVDEWWSTIDQESRAVFLSHLSGLGDQEPIMVLATLKGSSDEADPGMMRDLFSFSSRNRFEVARPDRAARQGFFEQATSRVRKAPEDFPASDTRKKRKLEELPVAPPIINRVPLEKERQQERYDDRIVLRVREWLDTFVETKKEEFPLFTKRMLNRDGLLALPGINDRLPDGHMRYSWKVAPNGDAYQIRDNLLGHFIPNLRMEDVAVRLVEGAYNNIDNFVTDIFGFANEVSVLLDYHTVVHAVRSRLWDRRTKALTMHDEARRCQFKIEGELGLDVLQDVVKRLRKRDEDKKAQAREKAEALKARALGEATNRSGSNSVGNSTQQISGNAGSSGLTNSQGPGFDNYAFGSKDGSAVMSAEKLNSHSSASVIGQAVPATDSFVGLEGYQPSQLSLMGPPAPPAPISRAVSSIKSILNIMADDEPRSPLSNGLSAHSSVVYDSQHQHQQQEEEAVASPPRFALDEELLGRVVAEFADRTSGCSVDQLEQIQRAIMEEIWQHRSMPDRNQLLRLVASAVTTELDDIYEMQGIITNSPEDEEAKRRRQYQMQL